MQQFRLLGNPCPRSRSGTPLDVLYSTIQCNEHTLQSMGRGLYNKDRVGSLLMGPTATWPRGSGQRQSQNYRSTVERRPARKSPPQWGPFSSLGPAGCQRGWVLGDTLMISAIVPGYISRAAWGRFRKEFAKRSRGRTGRLYHLPRAASALAPLFAPSSIFSLRSACEWLWHLDFRCLCSSPVLFFVHRLESCILLCLASSHVPRDLGRAITLWVFFFYSIYRVANSLNHYSEHRGFVA